jgi:hypothetical protein
MSKADSKSTTPKLDENETSLAVLNIKHMVEVAYRAAETLGGAGDDSDMFQMPADDANLLVFAIIDLQKRVKDLQQQIDDFNAAGGRL